MHTAPDGILLLHL